MGRHVGLLLVAAGILIVVLGILVWAGGLSWFGRLPGDIRIDKGNVRVYFPVVSMLLISVVASVLLTILQYLFRR
jgi:hypothetical protein